MSLKSVHENKYRHIGKYIPRKDAIDIVTGKAVYLDDYKRPGMLYARTLRSPYPNAIIKSINTEKAKALPGVAAVLTYEDVPQNWKTGMPFHRKVLDQHVRFVGDGVALIAAETVEIADEAMDLIEVEYEVLE